ncbi:transcriptional regulator GcvA [Ferruginivarius sediminum]|uniref:Transcriptional regulator GcvA n=1 Tax=Ferruginivarius sediminum TaxID=2661937 RepID=A0A369TH99_9PROT|nr:transcriptional regulator GcvA [Ferruginivarius sediminum]RDD63755.1 transcriptional regulator GcvA [Ferruginivarius sediminum]
MSRRLPPLNALRAFEAAARHLSFTKAAEELFVTQAAVSHQVKALEAQLGLALFRRKNRAILLTDAGQAYLPVVRDAFDNIAEATERLQAGEDDGPLRITTLQSFAAKWLLPRLSRFRAVHPDIDVLLATSEEAVDLHKGDMDAAIRFTELRETDLEMVHLMNETMFPVCSPALRDGTPPLETPVDLRHHTLLQDRCHDSPADPGWRVWMEAAGLRGIDPHRGPGYSDSSLVLQAAVAGQGVALGRRSLAIDDLGAGHLVSPFGPVLRTGYSYWFVCTPAKARDPRVRAFREWLGKQIREERLDPLSDDEAAATHSP